MWDLERENCIAQLSLPGPAAASGTAGAAAAAAAAGVEHIATSASSPLLYAADAAGTGEGETDGWLARERSWQLVHAWAHGFC